MGITPITILVDPVVRNLFGTGVDGGVGVVTVSCILAVAVTVRVVTLRGIVCHARAILVHTVARFRSSGMDGRIRVVAVIRGVAVAIHVILQAVEDAVAVHVIYPIFIGVAVAVVVDAVAGFDDRRGLGRVCVVAVARIFAVAVGVVVVAARALVDRAVTVLVHTVAHFRSAGEDVRPRVVTIGAQVVAICVDVVVVRETITVLVHTVVGDFAGAGVGTGGVVVAVRGVVVPVTVHVGQVAAGAVLVDPVVGRFRRARVGGRSTIITLLTAHVTVTVHVVLVAEAVAVGVHTVAALAGAGEDGRIGIVTVALVLLVAVTVVVVGDRALIDDAVTVVVHPVVVLVGAGVGVRVGVVAVVTGQVGVTVGVDLVAKAVAVGVHTVAALAGAGEDGRIGIVTVALVLLVAVTVVVVGDRALIDDAVTVVVHPVVVLVGAGVGVRVGVVAVGPTHVSGVVAVTVDIGQVAAGAVLVDPVVGDLDFGETIGMTVAVIVDAVTADLRRRRVNRSIGVVAIVGPAVSITVVLIGGAQRCRLPIFIVEPVAVFVLGVTTLLGGTGVDGGVVVVAVDGVVETVEIHIRRHGEVGEEGGDHDQQGAKRSTGRLLVEIEPHETSAVLA